MNKIAVIAAHPDDEILGCGGTIAKHIWLGDQVYVLVLSNGITSRAFDKDQVAKLQKLNIAAHEVHKFLGTFFTLYNLSDNRMDSLDRLDIVKMVESFIEKINPDIVYTHHYGDLNVDHRRVHEAVLIACRPVPGIFIKRILFFEVASSTEWGGSFSSFTPNWFVDITDTLEIKLKALEIYKDEMREFPHSRSLKALECLARWRGATIGKNAAEAFILGRCIE